MSIPTKRTAYRAVSTLIAYAEQDSDTVSLIGDGASAADSKNAVVIVKGNANIAAVRDFLVGRRMLNPGKSIQGARR